MKFLNNTKILKFLKKFRQSIFYFIFLKYLSNWSECLRECRENTFSTMPYAIRHQIPVSKREEIFLELKHEGRWLVLFRTECLSRHTVILELRKNELLLSDKERTACVTIVSIRKNVSLSAKDMVQIIHEYWSLAHNSCSSLGSRQVSTVT